MCLFLQHERRSRELPICLSGQKLQSCWKSRTCWHERPWGGSSWRIGSTHACLMMEGNKWWRGNYALDQLIFNTLAMHNFELKLKLANLVGQGKWFSILTCVFHGGALSQDWSLLFFLLVFKVMFELELVEFSCLMSTCWIWTWKTLQKRRNRCSTILCACKGPSSFTLGHQTCKLCVATPPHISNFMFSRA